MMNNLTVSFNPQSFRFSSAFLSLQLNLIPGKVLYSFDNIHTARVIYWTTHFFALGRNPYLVWITSFSLAVYIWITRNKKKGRQNTP